MANSPITNPAFWASQNPNNSGDLLELQRNQAIAQILLQQGLAGTPPTQSIGGVAIRQSPVEGLARLLQAYAGNKIMGDYADKLGYLNRKGYASLTGEPTMADPNQGPQPEPDQIAQALTKGASQGSVGPTNDNAQLLAAGLQQPQQQQQPSAPLSAGGSLNPGGLPTRLAAAMLMNDPTSYFGKQADAVAPTSEQKNAGFAYGGMQSPQAKAAVRAAVQKSGMYEMAPGARTTNLATGESLFNPKVSEGITLNPDNSAVQVPGYAAASSAITGANAAATEGAKMITVQLPDRTTVQMPQSEYLKLKGLASQPGIPSSVANAAMQNGDTNFAFNVGGQQGQVNGAQMMPGGISASGLGRSADPVATKAAEAFASNRANAGADYGKALDEKVATGLVLQQRMQEARQLLSQFQPGMGAESRLSIARAAQALGAPETLVRSINNGDVAAKQEFQKLAAQSALESLKQSMDAAGRITQAEFKVFLANNPNIELDPKAIEKIYDFADKVHQKNFAEQQSYDNYVNVQHGDPSRFPSWYASQQMAKQPDSKPTASKSTIRRYNPATGKIE